jgi:putative ABC transport system permease protein
MTSLWRDLHYALRMLRKDAGTSAIALATIALGIGASTALFSVVNAALLRALPYPHPEQIAWLAELNDAGEPMRVAYPNFEDWRKQSASFRYMAAYAEGAVNATGGDIPQRTVAAAVSQDFFEVLDVHPFLGRAFLESEHRTTPTPPLVLGYGLWQRGFGGDPGLIGKTVRLSGLACTVVGIMPRGFEFPRQAEAWLPLETFGEPGGRTAHNWRAIGRLKPHRTLAQARTELETIASRLKQAYPSAYQAKSAQAISLHDQLSGKVRPALLVLLAAVGFLVLIACANVANLLLARSAGRSRELAVRAALGASRRRLLRQLLSESLLLALAGGVLGLLAASWMMDLVRRFVPENTPRVGPIGMDANVLLFGLAMSAATGLLFGTLPAWGASRADVMEKLKEGPRGQTAGLKARRTGGLLVVSEVALALLLLTGAGLLLKSFWHLRQVDPGFRPDHVLTANLSFPALTAGDNGEAPNLAPEYRRLFENVRAVPGVQAVGTISSLPLGGDPDTNGHFRILGRPDPPGTQDAGFRIVSPDYFRALGIPLHEGRFFTESDDERAPRVALINAAMARRFWPQRDPLGQQIWFDSMGSKPDWRTIVGVVGDVRQFGLAADAEPEAYLCFAQFPKGLMETSLAVRTAVDPLSVAGALRDRIRTVNRDIPVAFRTMDQLVADSVSAQRFQLQVLAIFAALALLLAAVGIYGVLSYTVDRSRQEIGLRMALGAQKSDVFRIVLGRAMSMAAIGAGVGLLGSLALTRALASLLYGVSATDPMTFASAAAVLTGVALLASYLPARRAMRVDPIVTLRYE